MTDRAAPTSPDFIARVKQLHAHLKDSGVLDSAKSARGLHNAVTTDLGVGDPVTAAMIVAKSVHSYHVTHEQETARRATIAADLARDLQQLDVAREALSRYFDQVFDERKANFTRLFSTLDTAQAQGNLAGMQVALDSILALAQSSPFKNLTEIRELTKTSDFVLEL